MCRLSRPSVPDLNQGSDTRCSAQNCKDIYIDVKTRFVKTLIFLPNYLISVSFLRSIIFIICKAISILA
jgi:hypothetical protein